MRNQWASANMPSPFFCSFLWLGPGLSLTASFVSFLLSYLPLGLYVWNKHSLAVYKSNMLLADLSSILYLWGHLTPSIHSKVRVCKEREGQRKLHIREKWKQLLLKLKPLISTLFYCFLKCFYCFYLFFSVIFFTIIWVSCFFKRMTKLLFCT